MPQPGQVVRRYFGAAHESLSIRPVGKMTWLDLLVLVPLRRCSSSFDAVRPISERSRSTTVIEGVAYWVSGVSSQEISEISLGILNFN